LYRIKNCTVKKYISYNTLIFEYNFEDSHLRNHLIRTSVESSHNTASFILFCGFFISMVFLFMRMIHLATVSRRTEYNYIGDIKGDTKSYQFN